jgi:hypothetical protein
VNVDEIPEPRADVAAGRGDDYGGEERPEATD